MNDGTSEDSLLALYRFALDQASDAIVVAGAHGNILLANRPARELPGGLVERVLAETPPSGELGPFREALRQEGQARAEVRLEGRSIGIAGRSFGARLVLRFQDLTDRRRLETDLGALRRVESVGHFTASLIHDFNNLLTPIACLSACLENDLPAEAETREMAREIRSAAERAATLARQTLRWVRREPARAETVDLGAVLAEIAPLVQRVVGVEVEVAVSTTHSAGAVSLDRERLEHAILNLAANARDAMPQGGRLALRAARVSFDDQEVEGVEGARPGGYVAVRVADTGVGMNGEVRERLFEPLFTTKEAGRGTGLGLDGVRRFVAESGGCIWVQSNEGCGTTVSMYFPVVELPSAPPPTPRSLHPSGSGTVLVVDDDERVRRAMAAVLEARGYRVLGAATGEEALEVAKRHKPPIDVVVADVIMPGMGGLELGRRLREMGATRVLFTSGHTEDRLARSGLRPEDGPLLRKAFTPSELVHGIEDLLAAQDRAAPPSP
ncbi:MAG TPA: ATP-binding protein [Polyangiaceae bacterium]|nr:ATP-binding protein [Polyangiaceae bacterium]